MVFQAHRGVSSEAPENTFAAFRTAAAQGYGIIELDLGITADGVFVALHDSTLNRTARERDGAELKESLSIADISYKQALRYDFGVWFSPKYKGTRIPRLDEVLSFAAENGIKLKVAKHQGFTAEQEAALFALIKPHQDTISLTCSTVEAALAAAEQLPAMQIHYNGKVNDAALKALCGIKKERLTVWLPLESAAKQAKAVKRQASLGIWRISDYKKLSEAEALGADIVETNGEIKPDKRRGVIADMHTHSENSHDSECKIEDMCAAQAERQTGVFAVTDHCDIYSHKDYDIYTPLQRASGTVKALNAAQSKVKLLSGMEISEGFWLPAQMEKARELLPFDVIVGSVHCVRYESYTAAYADIDFSAMPMEKIYAYLHTYFNELQMLLSTTDIDILAHLTCPLRYITGRYGIKVDMSVFGTQITAILNEIIKKGIALEVNTSSYAVLGDFFPSVDIIKEYRALGGYLVTLGSDAHHSSRASKHFDAALNVLKCLGFKHIYYCKNRVFYQCSIA